MRESDKRIYYTLRIAAALCFIGHGTFGIITKQIWCNYFAVFGIGHTLAYKLMPLLGAVDIMMGISLLVYPTKAIVWWLVIWASITAFLRPLSGEPFAEFIERTGNYGAPLALLILCKGENLLAKGWFSLIKANKQVDKERHIKVTTFLQVVVFLLLAGHGWLNLTEKRGLMTQYASLGFSNPALVAHLTGLFELAAACMVLLRPVRQLVFVLVIWKIGTELFYPRWELFELIERAGSYGALLALWFALPRATQRTSKADSTQSVIY